MISESVRWRIFLLFCFISSALAQNRPPSIVQGPTTDDTYFSKSNVTIPCFATGTPPLTYDWMQNGISVNLNQPGISLNNGSLTIQTPTEDYFQCMVSNSYGKAISNITRVVQLLLDSAGLTRINTVTATAGNSYRLPCAPKNIRIVPGANYIWEYGTGPTDPKPQTSVILDKRIQVDDNGTLTFAYVLPADASDAGSRIYRCHLINTQLNALETSIAFTNIKVQNNPGLQTQMSTIFNYSSPSVALERNTVSLRCFFGGAPDIGISWARADGKAIAPGRNTKDFSRLQISNVQKSDEGVYICTGQAGSLQSISATVNLQVQSAPIFLSTADGPHDINVTNDDNVVVSCNAYADPPATVSWYLNGAPFDSNNLPKKFILSSDKKNLTILKVCKNCSDGSSDLMVIQCNASNIYGYAFANGYINVLDHTVITNPPTDAILEMPGPVVFSCSAISDVATPVRYEWTLKGDQLYDSRLNSSIPGLLYINIDGDGSNKFLGRWTCTATNGVSSDSKTALLQLPPSAGMASVQWWWWIPFVVILLLLLALLLLLICCFMIYRNRGEAYPVDEEERKGGNDPVKELQEIGFHDFQRPTDAPDGVILHVPLERGGGRMGPGSISSSIGKAASDDEMSLDNYSNINTGKFTEDGSFIGQYNPNHRKKFNLQPEIPESVA